MRRIKKVKVEIKQFQNWLVTDESDKNDLILPSNLILFFGAFFYYCRAIGIGP